MAGIIIDILERLHSDESRLVFLKSQYTPGNTEVADLILSINPQDTDVLKDEVKYAREHEQDRRFIDLAKRFADNYIENDWSILLKDMVIGWQNTEIAEYVIRRFASQADKQSPLGYAAEIAEAFGKKDEARKCLENLLEVQKGSEYAFSPAETCVKLGRYDEAIDLYLQSAEKGYGAFYRVLKVAREYKPQRLREVAQKGFDSFKQACGFWELFTECAEVIGKTEEAKKTALKAAEKKQDYHSPMSYTSLVGTLVKFGYTTQAQELVADAEKREIARKNSGGYYSADNSRELAGLFGLVGETTKARNEYLGVVDRALREQWHPSNIIKDIDKAYKLTGNRVFLDRKLQLYEQTQQYEEASHLAAQIGDNELAGTYKTMSQMVSSKPAGK